MFCRSIVKLPPPIVEEVAFDPAVNVKLSPSIAITVLLAGVDPWKLILFAAIPPVEAAPKILQHLQSVVHDLEDVQKL